MQIKVLLSIVFFSTNVFSQQQDIVRLSYCVEGERIHFEYNFEGIKKDTVLFYFSYGDSQKELALVFSKKESKRKILRRTKYLTIRRGGDRLQKKINVNSCIICGTRRGPTKGDSKKLD